MCRRKETSSKKGAFGYHITLLLFSCPARECHQQFKCKGNFVDSFTMSKLEKCIIACNSNDQCNWYSI